MAIAMTLRGFNDLGHLLLSPIFLLMGHFSTDFLCVAEK